MATNKSNPNKSKNEKPTPAASPVMRTETPAAKPTATSVKSTAPVTTQKSVTMPTDDDIRTRAYEIFVSEGCQDGQDLQNWLRAERELRYSVSH